MKTYSVLKGLHIVTVWRSRCPGWEALYSATKVSGIFLDYLALSIVRSSPVDKRFL